MGAMKAKAATPRPNGMRSTALMPLLALALVSALAGCNREKDTKGSLFPSTSNHVSPPLVAVPHLPPGSFDMSAGRSAQQAATAQRLAGDAAGARTQTERAVALWPADLASWDELAADCGLLKDLTCQRYAVFFHAKIEFVATLPPRVAVLGFASLNAAGVGVKAGDYVYDQQTLDTALRLASFYDERDQLRDARLQPNKAK